MIYYVVHILITSTVWHSTGKQYTLLAVLRFKGVLNGCEACMTFWHHILFTHAIFYSHSLFAIVQTELLCMQQLGMQGYFWGNAEGFTHNSVLDLCQYSPCANCIIIGASRSEPHTSVVNRDFLCMYVSYVRPS